MTWKVKLLASFLTLAVSPLSLLKECGDGRDPDGARRAPGAQANPKKPIKVWYVKIMGTAPVMTLERLDLYDGKSGKVMTEVGPLTFRLEGRAIERRWPVEFNPGAHFDLYAEAFADVQPGQSRAHWMDLQVYEVTAQGNKTLCLAESRLAPDASQPWVRIKCHVEHLPE